MSSDEGSIITENENEECVSNEELNELRAYNLLNPYEFEPEKNITEINDINLVPIPESNERLSNIVDVTNWCTCGFCKREEREIDRVCCQSNSLVDKEKLKGLDLFSLVTMRRTQ